MGVKVLLKNTLNTFKKKKFQLFAISIIIGLSSFLYTTMFYAINSLKQPLEDFMIESNQEDFSIEMINGLTEFDINNLDENLKQDVLSVLSHSLTDIKKYNEEIYNEVIENRISEFNKHYQGHELELRELKEINFENNNISNKITLFKDSQNINKSFIEEGKKPIHNDEIAITKVYAKKNNLKISDKLKIKDKIYKITGYVLFSDYTLPISNNDFIIDNSKITIGLVNDKEYESIKGKENFYISGTSNNLENFNQNVIKTYKDNEDLKFITNITLTKNQMRSGAIYEEIKGGEVATIGISVIISTIAVLIVLILVYKIVKNEKVQIGVLKALGYKNSEILKPYILLLLLISFPILLVGYLLGKYTSGYMRDFYLEFYLIPSGDIKTNIYVLIISIIVPIVTITGLCSILINKMLSDKAINLINVHSKEKVSYLNKLVSKLLKKAKPQTKFKYSFILSNGSKFAVFFIGILFSSQLIIMSLMMSGFFDKMSLDYYNSVDYVYEGIVDITKDNINEDKNIEKFINLPNGMYKDENISIVGIESGNKLHKLYDKKENNITKLLEDSVIVNKSFEITYRVNINDIIKININEDIIDVKIGGISNDYGSPKVYMNRANLSEIIVDNNEFLEIENDTFYNGVYSINKLDESKYLSVINKEDILKQADMMQKFIKIAIYSMIITAISIAVIVLYILTTMTIEDNYYSISLLKVMGYSKKEVNNMMLNSYLIYSIISYIISIPITVVGFSYMVKYLASEFNMIMPFEFELWHSLFGLIVIVVIFMIGSCAAKKRIEKVSLQEVLKTYRD